METQTKESMQQELAELEADLDTALEKYRELKEKIQACTDKVGGIANFFTFF